MQLLNMKPAMRQSRNGNKNTEISVQTLEAKQGALAKNPSPESSPFVLIQKEICKIIRLILMKRSVCLPIGVITDLSGNKSFWWMVLVGLNKWCKLENCSFRIIVYSKRLTTSERGRNNSDDGTSLMWEHFHLQYYLWITGEAVPSQFKDVGLIVFTVKDPTEQNDSKKNIEWLSLFNHRDELYTLN